MPALPGSCYKDRKEVLEPSDPIMSHEIVVLITTSNKEEAGILAEALVSQRLAACVNIVPAIESVYLWQGKVTRDNESLMIIKTTDLRYPELERRVNELHGYSTPEIVALRIDRGSEQYLSWLRDSTSTDENPAEL
ncbi:MAG TPA: divalent-cation tolerance protein CutA [Blastocatellia bacterium]|nr:divalent-cation tolerance protein CutA [Blastocatellia bacterium]